MNAKRKLSAAIIFVTSLVCGIKAQSIGDSLNGFAIDLLATTSSAPNGPSNLALSPYTVWTLLSIIDEGARGNTAKQLEKVLGIPDFANKNAFRKDFANMSDVLRIKDQDVNLDIYNSIFTTADQELNKQFRDISKNFYRVNVQPINFGNKEQASQIINKYVSQATRNRISNFIYPEDLSYAQIFMVSALYFKGTWTTPFNRSSTRKEAFFDESGNKIGDVEMMYHMGFFPYSRIDSIRAYAVELPYGQDNKMSMIAILPYNKVKLSSTLESMKKYPFRKILDTMDDVKDIYEGDDVKVYLPKFMIKSDLTLNGMLMNMGIIDVFKHDTADLLGMFPHYLYISKIIQRAEIEVNEEGTVAAAAAGAGIVNKSPPPKFLANKPFLYFIVNKPTRSIIFAGKVSTPP